MRNITINTATASTRNHQNTCLAINSRVHVTVTISLTNLTVNCSFTIRQGLQLLYHVHETVCHSFTIWYGLHLLYYVHVIGCCSFTIQRISMLGDKLTEYYNDFKKCVVCVNNLKKTVNQTVTCSEVCTITSNISDLCWRKLSLSTFDSSMKLIFLTLHI